MGSSSSDDLDPDLGRRQGKSSTTSRRRPGCVRRTFPDAPGFLTRFDSKGPAVCCELVANGRRTFFPPHRSEAEAGRRPGAERGDEIGPPGRAVRAPSLPDRPRTERRDDAHPVAACTGAGGEGGWEETGPPLRANPAEPNEHRHSHAVKTGGRQTTQATAGYFRRSAGW